MADIIQVNEAFRCQLLAREAESAAALLLAYGTVWTALADRRDAVLAVIERAQARGETVAPSLVIASRETRQLLLQVVGEIDSLAPALTDHVTTEQAAVALAQQALPNLIAAAMGPAPVNVSVGPVRHLPAEAFTDLVGFLSDGSPLRRLFEGFGADVSQQMRDALYTGLAVGENPQQIATRMRNAFGGNLMRALTVSRTETLRAWRRTSETPVLVPQFRTGC